MDEVVFIIQKRAINTNPAGLFASGLSSFAFLGVNMFSAIPNLGIKQGVGYAWRGCRQQGRFLLLQNLHSRLPWRLQIFAPCKICIHAIPGDQAAVKPPWIHGVPRQACPTP